MSIAGTYNQLADQGANYSALITWKDANGNAIDITGYTAKMQVRETYGAATVLLELSTANGKIVLGGAAGTITLSASATDMSFAADQYVYDLELTSPSGVVTRLLRGTFTNRPEVTL